MTRPKVDPDKRQRTAQACDSCKRRKQKCNGLKPCMTCEKRSLSCTYGSADEGSDEHPSPKRRMIETASTNFSPDHKRSDSPAATPIQHPTAWTPAGDGPQPSVNAASDGFQKGNDSHSLGAFISSVNEAHGNQEEKLPVLKKPKTLQSRASTASQGDEEAVVYSNTRMLQDPTGRLLYIGDSATLSFLQLIRMIVDNVAGPSAFTMDPRRHRIVENPLSLPYGFRRTHLLPDRETADILVNSYFTNVSGLIEVFHRKSFMTTMNMCYLDPLSVDPSWLCLLYLTFAIGLVMAAPIPGSREFSIIQKLRAESADRAEVFYCDAKSLGDPSAGFEDAGFWSIQALLLMAVYNLAISKRNAAYAYHGMAVRSAFALGLHREETFPIYSSSEQSIRRNLWRSLFVLDRFLATSLGRPTSIRESDCSGTTLSTGEMQSPLPQSPFPGAANSNLANTQSLGLAAAVRSCRVIGVILESVYSSRKISTKVAQEIADSCKSWHKDLDPSLNHRHQSAATPSQGIAILHINLLYCHSVILLTRPFFLFVMDKAHKERRRPGRKTLSRLERFAEACVSASSHTIALVQAALDKQYLPHRNPFVLYFLFASALVVIANEFSALFPNPNATSSINNAVGIMHFFAQQDTQGSRLLFILTSFRDVAVREQATRNQQQSMEQQQQPVFQQPLPPMNENDNDPMGNIFSPAKNQQQEKPTTPTPSSIDPILNGPLSNPTMTPPSNHISVRPNSAYPPNSNPSSANTTYATEHTRPRNNSIYSLDNFFDVERPLHTVSSSGSECNDSLGENAEIDFEMLWQWPNSHATGLTAGAGVAMGMNGEGMLGGMNGTGGGGLGGGLAVHDGNVPLFGMSSADFGAP